MKKGLFLLLAVLILSSFYILDKIYYQDKAEFLSPLGTVVLKIRSDRWGEGHFGAKRKNGRMHNGVDLLAPSNAPVVAAKGGWAISKFDKDGFGKYVKIYHNGGLMTLYAHLNDTEIEWLKKVQQGDIIGWVGKTGNARYKGIRPHIHFEVRKGGIPVDPLKGYLE